MYVLGELNDEIYEYNLQVQLTSSSLTLTGIMDFSLSGSSGKALMLTANQSISDLSAYGIGCANNGGGTDGQEYTFPAVGVSSGQHIILCRDSAALSTYFDGCLEQFDGAIHPTLIITGSNEPSGNGNDAYELFHNGNVIETFGDINSSAYTYRDSWAWKDTAAANVGNWVYGGNDCSDNSSSTQTSNCPFPLATTACSSLTPPTYTVTFNVHTDLIAGNVSSDGIYIGGGFVGGNNALLLDDSDGDGVWSGSTILDAAGGHFTSLNGNCADWSCKEDISGQSCADAGNYNDRNNLLGGFSQDTTLNLQFGSCRHPNPRNHHY